MTPKKYYMAIIILLITTMLLSGCISKEEKLTREKLSQFPQYTLSRPSRILISQGKVPLATLNPSNAQYENLFTCIKSTWFYPGQLKGSNDFAKVMMLLNEHRIDDTVYIIWFQYDEPVIWTDAFDPKSINKLQIRNFAFFPFGDKNQSNVKYMAVSENDDIFNMMNVYVYSYDSSIINIVRDILTDNKK